MGRWTSLDGFNAAFPDYKRNNFHHPKWGKTFPEAGSEDAKGFTKDIEDSLYDPAEILKSIESGKYETELTFKTPFSLIQKYTWFQWMHNLLCQPYLHLRLRVFPPYYPSLAEVANPDVY